jgi:hypothetical protein
VAKLNSGDAARRGHLAPGGPLDVSSWAERDLRRSGRSSRAWPVSVRLLVRLRRTSLDRELAAGADPCTNLQLACRARELCRPSLRRRLGADLERAVDAARVPAPLLTASIPLDRYAISECERLLLVLAEDLRSDRPAYARGVALTRLLLTDGDSPLYAPSEPRRLEAAARSARAALFQG